jgi:preprotein translocase subunit SecE
VPHPCMCREARSSPLGAAIGLLSSFISFIRGCWVVVRQLSAPSVPDALKRLGLILLTTLIMIVVVTTIDSSYLSLFVANARKLA